MNSEQYWATCIKLDTLIFNMLATQANPVISSEARNLLYSSTYDILFHTHKLLSTIFCCYLRIQEISRFARNDNKN